SRTGCAALAISAAVLAVIALCAAAALAVSGFFDKPDSPPEERLAKKAGLTEYRLRKAVRDGTLTDPEIAYAAGGQWSVEREPSAIRIVVGYSPESVCYEYEIPDPLNASTSIHRTRLEQCPALPKDPA
ncbi:hypothetical protein ACFU8Q_40940, partial [Streptomyces sp. NPDC057543]|uniref:hypothetical protein n=1 Tax=Streptomyces sp. NPDC057543 TaxID=3346163 RepID=UPI0036ACC713